MVERESAYVQSEALKIEALKRENDEELARCKPALEEAERAVSELNKNDITELKTFKQPPEVVELAIRCVFLYLGYGAKVEWKQALTVIADIKFLERLKTYDTKNIPQKILTGVGALIGTEAFNPNEMAQKSKVAGGLARWCRAIYLYAEAWKIVKPKEQKQRELAEKLAGAEHEVALKRAELDKVKGEIAKMEADYEALARYVQQLTDDKAKYERRLINARKLIDLLGLEGERWQRSVEQMEIDFEKLEGDVFVAAASISYFGPFSGAYREKLVTEWL